MQGTLAGDTKAERRLNRKYAQDHRREERLTKKRSLMNFFVWNCVKRMNLCVLGLLQCCFEIHFKISLNRLQLRLQQKSCASANKDSQCVDQQKKHICFGE